MWSSLLIQPRASTRSQSAMGPSKPRLRSGNRVGQIMHSSKRAKLCQTAPVRFQFCRFLGVASHAMRAKRFDVDKHLAG